MYKSIPANTSYSINSRGQVKRNDKAKLLTPGADGRVTLSRHGIGQSWSIEDLLIDAGWLRSSELPQYKT